MAEMSVVDTHPVRVRRTTSFLQDVDWTSDALESYAISFEKCISDLKDDGNFRFKSEDKAKLIEQTKRTIASLLQGIRGIRKL